METAWPLLVVFMALVVYCRFAIPILLVSQKAAEIDPSLDWKVTKGRLLNWSMVPVGMFIIWFWNAPIGFILAFVPVFTGAWMEIIMGHRTQD